MALAAVGSTADVQGRCTCDNDDSQGLDWTHHGTGPTGSAAADVVVHGTRRRLLRQCVSDRNSVSMPPHAICTPMHRRMKEISRWMPLKACPGILPASFGA